MRRLVLRTNTPHSDTRHAAELAALLALGTAASADDALWAGPSRVPAGWSQEKLNRAPNVLLITADQHRWDWLSAEGHPVVETPHLDRLASMGVRLNRAFCQSPACMPSRASFLTGRYPHFTGVMRNGGALPLDQYRHLLSRRLSDAGYYTGLAGKLHLRQPEFPGAGDQCDEWRGPDGLAEFHWSPCGNPGNWTACGYRHWLRDRNIPFHVDPFPECAYVQTSMTVETSQSAWCANRVIQFIQANASNAWKRPWYFNVNFFDPHDPWDPPRELLDKYLAKLDDMPAVNFVPGELNDKPPHEQRHASTRYGSKGYVEVEFAKMSERDHRLIRAAYCAKVELVDLQVGRIVQALEANGELSDTLIVYTSDHGEGLGDHGQFFKGDAYYDPVVRVPLLIAWPGHIAPQRVSDTFVELVDLAPTVLEAVGLPVGPSVQGRSLLPFLRGESAQHRDSALCMYNDPRSANGETPRHSVMVCTSDYKLVRFLTGGGEHPDLLYDRRQDPRETHNVWDDPAHVAARAAMLATLSERLMAIADRSELQPVALP